MLCGCGTANDPVPRDQGVTPLQAGDGAGAQAGNGAGAQARPGRYAPPRGAGHLAALLREPAVVRVRPGGAVAGRLGRRTPFGAPTSVWIRATRAEGRWVGVVSTATSDGRLGWIDRRRTRMRLYRSAVSLHVDLSARMLELREDGRVRRRMPVTIGAPDTPTPTGAFAVTDKIDPAGSPNPYGCCILALSGRQPHLRPGWAGGDRIAIHGSAAGRAGEAASAGCLRARDRDLRALMEVVLLGSPVVIRA